MVLICVSLVTSTIERYAPYLLASSMSSSEKCLFSPSDPFLNQIFFFWLLSCVSSLSILDVNPLPDICFANIFSHSIGYLRAGDF